MCLAFLFCARSQIESEMKPLPLPNYSDLRIILLHIYSDLRVNTSVYSDM